MAEHIEREAVCYQLAKQATIDGQPRAIKRAAKIVADFPAADVPPALWTDEPISGTEFMAHNQGQSGFEIHFRTDDKAKYEAVQDECRRQIDHAKPAADVRPVVRGRWEVDGHHIRCSICGEYMCNTDREGNKIPLAFCPNCGATMMEVTE